MAAPNQSQASNGFEYTVRSLEITPVTSRLSVDSTGLAPTEEANKITKMYYELVNQQGERVKEYYPELEMTLELSNS
ncbi:hypothetical protein GCM10007362_29700 [Saccharibacillus endophyticus]|uniref:Uncharacterized protein n=1 Tax=Saccharibacillus endophyticus TaxID=2060666 RepID=A0ABQ1ZW27_9BACL|nr:hypothetical protein GCM10007362_29700 [Saccharibacillus endophyticus]